MGAMLANPCHPYIQRGYRPFVIARMAKVPLALLARVGNV